MVTNQLFGEERLLVSQGKEEREPGTAQEVCED
jgi:hypothetical protein